ncbi:unnamed protein product [Effrenium voratum]|nr:unnamed protein product [Effrenium voratum]
MVTVSLVSGNSVVLPFSGKATVFGAALRLRKGLLTLVAEARILDPDLTLEESRSSGVPRRYPARDELLALSSVIHRKGGDVERARPASPFRPPRRAVFFSGWRRGQSRAESVRDRNRLVHALNGNAAARRARLGSVFVAQSASCGVRWEEQLVNVEVLAAGVGAFAAVKCDGSVVTWGHARFGGDCSEVQEELQEVKQVTGSVASFAALRADGSVVTWGLAHYGGSTHWLQQQLQQVQHIEASRAAFAALKADGSVVTWGDPNLGGDSSAVQQSLSQVQQVSSTEGAFVALSEEHRAVCWGESSMGGRLPDDLGDVRLVRGTSSAFAALMTDGRVLAWGNRQAGGDIPAAAAAELGRGSVVELCASSGAFAALKADGSVVTWGNPKAGGDSSAVQEQLKQVTQIARCLLAFAAAARRDS